MNTWHIIATNRMDEVALESKETTEGAVRAKALELSRLCPHAIIVVRDFDENDRWAYENGMEVDL